MLAHDENQFLRLDRVECRVEELLDVGFLLDLYFYKPLEPFKCTHACDIALQGQEIELCTAKHWRGKNWMEDRLQKRAWRQQVKKDGGRGRHGSTAVSLSAPPSSVVSVRHSLISSYDDDDKVIKADVGGRWNKVSLSLHFQDRAAARSLVLK